MSVFICKKCANQDYYLKMRGFQVGLYCSHCGSWQKWVGKKDLLNYKSNGHPIYSESDEVPLKSSSNMGIDESINISDSPFDVDVTENSSDNSCRFDKNKIEDDVEKEVERRVNERLKQIDKKSQNLNKLQENQKIEESKNTGYCSCCEGIPLKADNDSRVEVTIFGGVMTITDLDGLNIYGIYRLKNCPYCGREFK